MATIKDSLSNPKSHDKTLLQAIAAVEADEALNQEMSDWDSTADDGINDESRPNSSN